MVNLLINPTMGRFHRVKFLRDVNECKAGEIKDVMITRMLGRIYKQGRNSEGKFIDTVGEKDNRICAMGLDEFYHVFESEEDLQNSFDEIVATV